MSNQTSNDSKEKIMQEILRITKELETKVEALPVEDGDNTPEGRAIKKERKEIIADSIHDVKRICHLLEAADEK